MIPKEDASRLNLLSAKKNDSIILNNFIDSDTIENAAFIDKTVEIMIEITSIL
ncbi:hypothetical protein [Chryseobacterium taiwanense]|uniref:hypothetical protein n=1 Tax=Chryseobacterium taiwanense TaxID=363331 RepID=UPI000AAB5145|nr:hypothetical protein [Chryseobacterium taiwanense]